MNNLKLNLEGVYPFVSKEKVFAFKAKVEESQRLLHSKTGKGNDFLGWLHLPSSITTEQLNNIKATAESLSQATEVVVVIGIGGSYLGSKAVIDALSNSFSQLLDNGAHPHIVYAGQNIGEDYHYELLQLLEKKSGAAIVISKSGTTTEPALAFRLIKNHLEAKYCKLVAKNRIVAITDESKGALRTLATQEGYTTYVIPDDVGGRYSVLTPVGLLPIAVAGFDIHELVRGAQDMEKFLMDAPFEENPAMQYAAVRNALYSNGKKMEILANFEPKLHFMTEWWKQLYGESEGKENKGIFTAGVDFTTDLHSMGQYIQEGERFFFETVLSIAKTKHQLVVPTDKDNLDQLNFIAGKRIDQINKMAELGTKIAHIDGNVPNIHIEIPELTEYNLGALIYFFEKACALSGYTLDVNPFDQPGVEAYKKNMFALLNKKGFEKEGDVLRKRLGI
ncbi:glucose-6-phosphate isomerase [Williamwhitmania taraxaci]|uniref:Glucose-6-phosphate isomerase n=1 Tax=Williamwhitmania taraxaci TaxID=1640674 RepID=A0A1G6I162_9BACT|nr:glucose-6-phosphate isomerase [Williamwhitmania taraxaci]SDC00123.1 glucose-6-phosphate isomerase [Williamwhitmania taraxaci]